MGVFARGHRWVSFAALLFLAATVHVRGQEAQAPAESIPEQAAEETPLPEPAPDTFLGSPAVLDSEPPEIDAGFPVLRTFGGLGVVVSLILIGFLAARKYAPQYFARTSVERRLKLLESMSMGEKRSVAVVQLEERQFLIGSTPGSITLLAALEPRGGPVVEPTATAADRESRRAEEPLRSAFRNLYEVEKRAIARKTPPPVALPADLRAKMQQLRDTLER